MTARVTPSSQGRAAAPQTALRKTYSSVKVAANGHMCRDAKRTNSLAQAFHQHLRWTKEILCSCNVEHADEGGPVACLFDTRREGTSAFAQHGLRRGLGLKAACKDERHVERVHLDAAGGHLA